MLFKNMSNKKKLLLGIGFLVAGAVSMHIGQKQLDKELHRIQLNMIINHQQRK